jgi:thiosulfate/3-mercaptopyruvate sulfurtransferase
MSRSEVLVDADRVQERRSAPSIAIVKVDEDTSTYEKNHTKNAIRIDWARVPQSRTRGRDVPPRPSRHGRPQGKNT